MVVHASCADDDSVGGERFKLELLEGLSCEVANIALVAQERVAQSFVAIGELMEAVVEFAVAALQSVEFVGLGVFVDADIGCDD